MWLQKVKKGSWLVVFLVGATFLMQGCLNGDDEDYYDAYKFLEEDIVKIQEYLEANQIDAEMDSATGVYYQIHKEGDGYKTIQGIEVEIHYQGLTIDGEEFVNTFGGIPKTISIGDVSTYPATVTGGVTIGLSHMGEGDSATVYTPSPYGFQDKYYQGVQPNTILIYNIKFENVKNLDEDYEKIDQYIIDNNMTAEIEPDYGIRYVIHREGNNISPKPGATVSTQYQGELLDGTVFDSSYDSGIPLDFTYGNGELIVGFEMGVSQLHENDSATIFIPSIYGYKDQAVGDIPANSVLIFGLDITRIANPF